jgi:hypothetical protein
VVSELFLGTKWEFFFFFLYIFDGKKRTTTFRLICKILCEKFEETNYIFEFILKKYLISRKIIQNGVREVEVELSLI